jgi:hypothetical protein
MRFPSRFGRLQGLPFQSKTSTNFPAIFSELDPQRPCWWIAFALRDWYVWARDSLGLTGPCACLSGTPRHGARGTGQQIIFGQVWADNCRSCQNRLERPSVDEFHISHLSHPITSRASGSSYSFQLVVWMRCYGNLFAQLSPAEEQSMRRSCRSRGH